MQNCFSEFHAGQSKGKCLYQLSKMRNPSQYRAWPLKNAERHTIFVHRIPTLEYCDAQRKQTVVKTIERNLAGSYIKGGRFAHHLQLEFAEARDTKRRYRGCTRANIPQHRVQIRSAPLRLLRSIHGKSNQPFRPSCADEKSPSRWTLPFGSFQVLQWWLDSYRPILWTLQARKSNRNLLTFSKLPSKSIYRRK